MAEKSFIYIANATTVDGVTTYDRVANADDVRSMIYSLVGNGVYANPATNLQVIKSDTGDMVVKIQDGRAWLRGGAYTNVNGVNDVLEFTVPTADGTNDRIDTIVLRDATENRATKAFYVTGTPAAVPAAPVPSRTTGNYELVLAQIYVARGAVKIAQANIMDTRFDTDLCGVVTGLIEQIDFTSIFDSYGADFEEWFDTVKNQLSTDAAGNLQIQIDALKAEKKIYTSKPANPTAGDLFISTEDKFSPDEIYNGTSWIKRYSPLYKMFSAYRSADTVKSGQQYDVVLNSSDVSNECFQLSSGEVAVLKSGTYLVSGAIYVSDGASCAPAAWRIQIKDSNSEFNLNSMHPYLKISNNDYCYMNVSGVVHITAGATVKLSAICAGSTGSFRVAGGESKTWLHIQLLETD